MYRKRKQRWRSRREQENHQQYEPKSRSHSSRAPLIAEGSFSNSTLIGLIENEITANKYYGKMMHVYHNQDGHFKGKFTSCDTTGMLNFEDTDIDDDGINVKYTQYRHEPTLRVFYFKEINDLLLIKNPGYDSFEDTNDLQSVKDEILDMVKLKMIEYLLHILTTDKTINGINQRYDAFHIKNRKKYLKSSTKDAIKKEIGNKILKVDIPIAANYGDPLYEAIEKTIRINQDRFSEAIKRSGDTNDVLILLHNYDRLWEHHITTKDVLSGSNDDIKDAENVGTRHNYMDWDKHKDKKKEEEDSDDSLGKIRNRRGPSIAFMRRMYERRERGLEKEKEKFFKAKDVNIKSFWPYLFHGPYTKSKQRNPDWKCMKCNQQSMFRRFGGDLYEKKIIFYKARRNDVTVEICYQCVQDQERKNQRLTTRHRLRMNRYRAVRYRPPMRGRRISIARRRVPFSIRGARRGRGRGRGRGCIYRAPGMYLPPPPPMFPSSRPLMGPYDYIDNRYNYNNINDLDIEEYKCSCGLILLQYQAMGMEKCNQCGFIPLYACFGEGHNINPWLFCLDCVNQLNPNKSIVAPQLVQPMAYPPIGSNYQQPLNPMMGAPPYQPMAYQPMAYQPMPYQPMPYQPMPYQPVPCQPMPYEQNPVLPPMNINTNNYLGNRPQSNDDNNTVYYY